MTNAKKFQVGGMKTPAEVIVNKFSYDKKIEGGVVNNFIKC